MVAAVATLDHAVLRQHHARRLLRPGVQALVERLEVHIRQVQQIVQTVQHEVAFL